MSLNVRPIGDSAVRVALGERPGVELFHAIRAFCLRLRQAALEPIVEYVPTLTAVTVYYRPQLASYDAMCRLLGEILPTERSAGLSDWSDSDTVVLPVCYGGAHGPDLEFVAGHHGMTAEQVIEIHTSREYLVYMMGFAPGFGYLWGLPESLATPRLDVPRTRVRAGSVGIGGQQTGVYSVQTPGGWRIIGHTPVPLFDLAAEKPFLLAHGDRVRFEAVTAEEHARIERQVADGRFDVRPIRRREPRP